MGLPSADASNVDVALMAQVRGGFRLFECGYPTRYEDGTWVYRPQFYAVRNKSVYVYRRKVGATSTPELVDELQTDAQGQIVGNSSDKLTVTYVILGQEYEFFFLATRASLTPGQREHLEAVLGDPKYVPAWRFSQQPDFDPPPGLIYGPLQAKHATDTETTWIDYVYALDPMSVALTLHHRYFAWCEAQRAHVGPSTSSPITGPEVDEKARINQRKFLLASHLAGILDAGDQPDIGKYLALPPTGDVRAFAKNYIATGQRIQRNMHASSAVLCNWLTGDLFRALMDAYDDQMTNADFRKDYCAMLGDRARCESRLAESATGLNYLAHLVDAPDAQYSTFILPDKTTASDIFEIAEGAKSFVTTAWTQLIPALILKAKKKGSRALVEAPTKIVDYLRRTTHLDLGNIKTVEKTIAVSPSLPGGTPRPATVRAYELEPEQAEKLDKWFGESKVCKTANGVFAFISFCSACAEFSEKKAPAPGEPDDRAPQVLAMLGAVAEESELLLDAFEATEEFAPFAGLFGAGMTIDASLFELKENEAYGNYGAVVGDGVQVLGGMLQATAISMSMFAGEAASTGVGVAPATVATIGAGLCFLGKIVATACHTSELQKLASFCVFGIRSGQGPQEQPKWAPAAFKEWSNDVKGLDHQVTAAVNLLSGFSLCAQDFTTVRVYPGILAAGSRFTIEFHGVFSAWTAPGTVPDQCEKKATCVYDCDSQMLVWTGGDPVQTPSQPTPMQHTAKGRSFFDVTFSPMFAQGDGVDVYDVHCHAWLQLDAQTRLPRSGAYDYRVSTKGLRKGWPGGELNGELSIWDEESVSGTPQ